MKKILMSMMVIALAAAIAAGGTIAYFSDEETSSENTFTAGTLDLGLANASGTDPTTGVTTTWVSPSDWAPGDTVDATLYINNEGTIPASNVTVDFDYSLTEGTPATVDPGTTSLEDMIKATTVTLDAATVTALQGKTLAELKALDPYDLGSWGANTEKALRIVWTFDSGADNGCQGDTATVTLTLNANQ